MTVILVAMDGPLVDVAAGMMKIIIRDHPLIALSQSGRSLHTRFSDNYPWQHKATLDGIMLAKRFYLDLPQVDGAIAALNAMVLEDHEVFICTAPNVDSEHCASEKLAWVRQNMGVGWVNRTIICHDKTMIQGDFLIDVTPNPKGALIPSWQHILYAASYNSASRKLLMTDWSHWRSVLGLRDPRYRSS
jgi:5'-nucleotidase